MLKIKSKILKNKKAFTFQLGIYAMLTAFLLFGLVKLYYDEQVNPELKNMILENAEDEAASFLVFGKSLDDLTPTVGYGNRDKFLLNEFPMFTWTHSVLIVLLFIVAGWIMHLAKAKKLTMFLVFLLLLFVGYFLASGLILLAYHISAGNLGLTFAEAEQFRKQYNGNFENVMLPLVIAGLVAILSILKTFIKQMKK